jgi:hypothetical protein
MSCEKIMCKYKLHDKSLIRDWLKINHPDKGGTLDRDEFIKVLECYKNNITCKEKKANEKKANEKTSNTKNTRKKRAKIFTCMRKTANFSKILNYHKFDKAAYDPKKLNEELVEASPKMVQLLNNIRELDSQDVKYHGKKFKHFIFSDVKEGGYGAKIIASAFQANGYNNILKSKNVSNQINAKLYLDLEKSNYQNFALLSSNSVYGTTFNEKIKKEVLKLYNERPANIHGKNVRLIILDSGFKEGIDLFDVKYVHIFEPSITIADLKQTIGRATRTCGQKGLEFQKNIGWPLYVYNYYLTIPEITSGSMYVNRSLMENNFKSYNKDDDVLLFKNVEKYNDATMNYSEFDSAMIQLAKQLYELAPLLAVDYYLTKNIHKANDLNREFVLSGTLMAVQEKKTAKGQPFAIIKLSDLSRMYELFIFSEILLANRDKMIPGNSFLINIVKEKMTNGTTRLTTRKLTEINSIKEAKINNAEITIKNLESINELKKILKDGGDTKVLIRMNSKDKNYAFNLKTNKLIDASIVSVLNSSGFECKIH